MLTNVETLEQEIRTKERGWHTTDREHTNISILHMKTLEQIDEKEEEIKLLKQSAINLEEEMQALGGKQVQAEHELAYLKRDLALAIIKPNVPSTVYKEVTSYFGGKDDEEI